MRLFGNGSGPFYGLERAFELTWKFGLFRIGTRDLHGVAALHLADIAHK